jgi:hypothetical protein
LPFSSRLLVLVVVALLGAGCGEKKAQSAKPDAARPVVCDLEKARAEMPELERRCTEGDAKSCFELGTYIHGRPWCGPVTAEPQRIRAWGLFEKACLLGYDDVCDDLFYRTYPLRRDYPATIEELDVACAGGVGFACLQRGEHIHGKLGEAWEAAVDRKEFFRRFDELDRESYPWYQRGCKLGISTSCEHEAIQLRDGRGISADPVRAVKMLDDACRRHRAHPKDFVTSSLGCLWLAQSYDEGLGVARDWQRSRTIRHEVCRLDKLCDDLFLVPSSDLRQWVWALEYTAAAASNGLALLWRRRRSAGKRMFPLLFYVASVAGLSIAWELWYYFTGSNLQSPAWWAVALVPVLLPLWVWIRHLRYPHVIFDG